MLSTGNYTTWRDAPLADPQQFANTYVASLHLPFPLFFSYAAGFSELIGSWLVILGLLTPWPSAAR